jgi:hypothetical protein
MKNINFSLVKSLAHKHDIPLSFLGEKEKKVES